MTGPQPLALDAGRVVPALLVLVGSVWPGVVTGQRTVGVDAAPATITSPRPYVAIYRTPSGPVGGLDVVYLTANRPSTTADPNAGFARLLTALGREVYGDDFADLRLDGYFALDRVVPAAEWLGGAGAGGATQRLVDAVSAKVPAGTNVVPEPRGAAVVTASASYVLTLADVDSSDIRRALVAARRGTEAGTFLANFRIRNTVQVDIRTSGTMIMSNNWRVLSPASRSQRYDYSGRVDGRELTTPQGRMAATIGTLPNLRLYRRRGGFTIALGFGKSSAPDSTGALELSGLDTFLEGTLHVLTPYTAVNLGLAWSSYVPGAAGTPSGPPAGTSQKLTRLSLGPRLYLPITRTVHPFLEGGFEELTLHLDDGIGGSTSGSITGRYLTAGLLFNPESTAGARGGLQFFALYRMFSDLEDRAAGVEPFKMNTILLGATLRLGRY